MKVKILVLALLSFIVVTVSASVQPYSSSSLNQSQFNSLASCAVWHGEGVTDGDLNIKAGTAYQGVSTAWYIPTVIPISISQANGILSVTDNGATPHSFIPPSSASIGAQGPITGFAISLYSPYAGYTATITDISYALNGGPTVNVNGSLDTSTGNWKGIQFSFNNNVSAATFTINFDLNLPQSEAVVSDCSQFDVLGLGKNCMVPEPSTIACVGLGAVLLLIARRNHKRKLS